MRQGVRDRQKCRSAVVLHQSGPLNGVLQLRRNTSVTLGSAQGNGPDLCKGCGTGPKRRPGAWGSWGWRRSGLHGGQALSSATSKRAQPCGVVTPASDIPVTKTTWIGRGPCGISIPLKI
jgi:hypothetical protein